MKNAAAKVKSGVENFDVGALESNVIGKMNAALEKVESAGGAALEKATGGTPSRPSHGQGSERKIESASESSTSYLE